MMSIYPVSEGNVVNCEDVLSIALDKLMTCLPSCFQIINCTEKECMDQVLVRKYSVDVRAKDFREHGMSKFDQFVGKLFEPSFKCCPTCEKSTAVMTHDVHDYLCFNLLDIYDPEKTNLKCSLSEIPTSINILDKEFTLCGAIEHNPGHFLAHTRTITGSWRTTDGMYPKKRAMGNSYRPHHLSMLLYVRWR